MSNFRRRLMGVQQHGGLPAGYQEVEYIESTGTQYIDTLVYPSNNTSFFIKIRADGRFDKTKNVAGSRINNTNNKFGIISFSSTSKFGYFFGSQSFQSQVNIDNKIYEFELDKDKFMVDNEILTYPTNNEFEVPYTIFLFGFHNDNMNQYNSYRLYDCKIKEKNILKRIFVPCYRKIDNTIGMYDLVEGVFYTNQGTGTFLKGADV